MPVMDSSSPSFSAEAWIASALLGQPLAAELLPVCEWEQVVHAADAHGVGPLLLQNLSQCENWKTYPAEFRESLSKPTYQQVAWDMGWQNDLGKILDQFDRAGIRYLLIKGAGVAFTHYEHSYLRVRCDTDILFPDMAVFEQAWALLKSMGFLRQNTLSGEFVGYQHCCYRPLGQGFQQVLDCHIRINDYQFFADAFSFDELYAHAVPLPQLAESARTLGPVHALLMACMHRVGTIPFGNADRLIWLFDMYLLARSFSDDQWQEFLALARQRQLCGSCVHSLEAARGFFPIVVPGDLMTEMQQFAKKEPFKPGQEMKRWRYYFHVFKSVPGLRNKAKLVQEHFLPSGDYLMQKYQTSNRFALPFLYVRRVFGGLRRYF
ncbi:nucleotidyltransferase family protein [Pseudomonadota bacterium]